MVVSDNIDNNASVEATKSNDAFDKQTKLLDKTLENIYNDELYHDDILRNGIYYQKYFDKNGKDILKNFKQLFKSNSKKQESTIDVVTSSSDNVSNSYNYSVDMYRNQDTMNRFLENKVKKFRKRNKALLEEVDDHLKMKQLRTYYYKKKKAQIKILYSIIITSVIAFILSFLNKNFDFIMSDSLFVILLAILFVAFSGYVFMQIIEIMFRSNIDFDEYDFQFNLPRNYADGEGSGTGKSKSDEEKCAIQIQNYKKLMNNS